jgi:hypothetical protein
MDLLYWASAIFNYPKSFNTTCINNNINNNNNTKAKRENYNILKSSQVEAYNPNQLRDRDDGCVDRSRLIMLMTLARNNNNNNNNSINYSNRSKTCDGGLKQISKPKLYFDTTVEAA